MQIVLRWLTTAIFYLSNLVLLLSASQSQLLRHLYAEPLILLECFIALGLIASDFLTPSLSQISRDILHISDRVSGLTLLALGNAIPDITSTYQAMSAGATSLAIGELFGGIFFLLTVVLGSMALVKPIELRRLNTATPELADTERQLKGDEGAIIYSRKDFVQDIVIFAGLVLLSAIFLSDGRLMFWECVLMFISYCSYAAFLVLHHKAPAVELDSPLTSAEAEDAISDLSTFITNSGSQNEGNVLLFNNGIRERRANIRRRIRKYLRSNYHGWVRITLRDCLDIWENENLLQASDSESNQGEGDSEDGSERCGNTLPPIRRTTSLQEVRRIDGLPTIIAPDDQSVLGSAVSSVESEDARWLSVQARPFTQKSLSCDHIPDFYTSYYGVDMEDQESHDARSCSEESIIRSWPRDFKLFEFLTDGSMTLPTTEYAALLFTTPIALILCLLIPFLHHRREDGDLHNMEIIRLTLLPLIIWFLVSEPTYRMPPTGICIASVALLCILVYRRKKSIVNHNSNLLAVASFILCLSSICFCVHVVVMTLTNWAKSFDISGTILGLTVFAWGNSLGDLVSNVIFVQIGVLDIALGACFGSPLLYFVFGIGVDGIILMSRRRQDCEGPFYACHIDYKIDSHLGYSGVGIVLAFLVFAIAVPLNRWRIDGKISALLLTTYAVVIGLSIYQEFI